MISDFQITIYETMEQSDRVIRIDYKGNLASSDFQEGFWTRLDYFLRFQLFNLLDRHVRLVGPMGLIRYSSELKTMILHLSVSDLGFGLRMFSADTPVMEAEIMDDEVVGWIVSRQANQVLLAGFLIRQFIYHELGPLFDAKQVSLPKTLLGSSLN